MKNGDMSLCETELAFCGGTTNMNHIKGRHPFESSLKSSIENSGEFTAKKKQKNNTVKLQNPAKNNLSSQKHESVIQLEVGLLYNAPSYIYKYIYITQTHKVRLIPLGGEGMHDCLQNIFR